MTRIDDTGVTVTARLDGLFDAEDLRGLAEEMERLEMAHNPAPLLPRTIVVVCDGCGGAIPVGLDSYRRGMKTYCTTCVLTRFQDCWRDLVSKSLQRR